MALPISNAIRAAVAAVAFAIVSGAAAPGAADAGEAALRDGVVSTQTTRTIRGERYIPGISITPDGCEVWVMDDGAEGYAVEHVTRDGRPVCRDINVCGVMNADQYFATDSYRIHPKAHARLREFFEQASAFGYIIVGHTDARASQEYNMRLSYNRANSVARVARQVGARVIDVRGYGENYPTASNATAEGMSKNRRVEILCVR